MREPQRFYLVSLGCPKNLVDSVGLATLLEQAGHIAVNTPEEATLLIVNTCGFIEPARAESRQVLRDLTQARQPGQQIVAAGCYAQRFPYELAQAIPGLDGLIGTRHWMDIVPFIEQIAIASRPVFHSPSPAPSGRDPSLQQPALPRIAVQEASAYLKLADGCRRSCAFCAIPLIKGPAVSRPPEAILADARWLAEQGVREINLIAQDTTDYGRDLGLRQGLTGLLEQLVTETPEVDWIRIMYAYPSRIKDRLIETIARHPQILPYLDLPLQHAHPDVLRRMRRPSDIMQVCRTIERLRSRMPEIALRTTFLVGFPGESEEEFELLLDFVYEMEFDRVGVFVYSHEEGTPAAELEDDVPPEVKEERRERLMELQQPISLARNQALVGQTLDVLVEGLGEGLSVGRSYRDAPEIDGLVLVQAELPVGEILPVRITAALEYDLVGEAVT
ncbi:MAG TPA: 30S ribosomal protein S12 methylthiotransferase RimO [Chloroflexi bacterium]|nr:30S ribosomal protein S12 methylthiotransferase RimO [Chloroflexota bacterium]